MWLMICVLSALVKCVLRRRGQIALPSDVTPSACPFEFCGRLAFKKKAGCLTLVVFLLICG